MTCTVCDRNAVLRIDVETTFGVATTDYCSNHIFDGYVAALVFSELPRLTLLDTTAKLRCPLCGAELMTGHRHGE